MKAIPLLLAASLAIAGANPAAASAPWRVLPGSTLGFAASFEGEAFEGNFAKFTPRIDFDPKQLASSRFDVAITLASADTKNDERDDALHGTGFFNSAKTPQARYLATRFRALGGNRYAADGTLTLNGISKPVVLEFSWTPGAKQTVLAGSASLKRLDFNVGVGEWSDTSELPNEVRVRTRLLLAPGTPAAKKP
jgi:polyisoprenoid-binding protein YceI